MQAESGRGPRCLISAWRKCRSANRTMDLIFEFLRSPTETSNFDTSIPTSKRNSGIALCRPAKRFQGWRGSSISFIGLVIDRRSSLLSLKPPARPLHRDKVLSSCLSPSTSRARSPSRPPAGISLWPSSVFAREKRAVRQKKDPCSDAQGIYVQCDGIAPQFHVSTRQNRRKSAKFAVTLPVY
jgi:hypothetical protein